MSQATLDEMLIRFPLPPGQEAYADIDGRQMHKDVIEQANIARRYRDQGHPKFWGRIIGTSADAESAQWLVGKFKAAGLTDVRIQPLDLVPQWFPQSWDVTIAGGGKSIALDSAQPDYGTVATPPEGLDLEAVYVGLGSEADFAGRDVKGKAVFVFTMLGAPNEGAVRRAADKGAAAIFEVNMLPGNARYQAYPSRTRCAGVYRRPRRRPRGAGDHRGHAGRAVRAREGQAPCRASAEPENRARLGNAAGSDR